MKICLNMIVKNEAQVIERCLLSVRHLIDYWIIVDTGSTDGTQEKIRQQLSSIPGKLYERPWVDFASNRNEALLLARGKADFLLFIDADEILEVSPSFQKADLVHDFYQLRVVERNQTDIYRVSLIKDHPAWFWKGVIHEGLYASRSMVGSILETLRKISCAEDGYRTKDPQKFVKDAAILEKALAKEPENSRYTFYLAQSYGNAGLYEQAIRWYKKRTTMGDHPEEVFWSFYCIGLIQQHIGSDPQEFIQSYTEAYQYNSQRAEPLYQIALYYYQLKLPLISYFLSKIASSLTLPVGSMYMHAWIYDYAALQLLEKSAEAIGLLKEV